MAGKLRLTVTPYSFSKNMFGAYCDIMSMVNADDWVCFTDCDVAFLEMSDFGDVIQGYIDRYPDTGMFTCYASRCHYSCQRTNFDMGTDSIVAVAQESVDVRNKMEWKYKSIKRKVAGHLLVMQKRTWLAILPTLNGYVKKKKKKILGFDTQLSRALLIKGYDIKLMEVFVFHYLRMLNGKNDKIE